jgi:hypothetical protein
VTPRELKQYGITREAVLDAIDSWDEGFACHVHGCRGHGLCYVFGSGLEEVLIELGGKENKEGYYWATPTKDGHETRAQRAMMLAFLYEWTEE